MDEQKEIAQLRQRVEQLEKTQPKELSDASKAIVIILVSISILFSLSIIFGYELIVTIIELIVIIMFFVGLLAVAGYIISETSTENKTQKINKSSKNQEKSQDISIETLIFLGFLVVLITALIPLIVFIFLPR